MIDCNFPHIKYEKNKSNLEWGKSHGESFRQGIKELCEIRKDLMLKKNPSIKEQLDYLSSLQVKVTRDFCPHLLDEMEGIALGAKVSLEDIVILNNYTDFRDLELPEEGCSTLYKKESAINSVGQTWDMHSSAKNYVSVIEIEKEGVQTYLFSLVGCLGMMGINSNGLFLGVNNINTKNAQAGLIWPALVRLVLESADYEQGIETLINAPVTSGHNYIISDINNGAHYEISPLVKQRVATHDNYSYSFHTNHCLSNEMIDHEDKDSISSTTHARFNILDKNMGKIDNHQSFIDLLKDHEGYPKSICSHFESGAQDPSMTCGGGTFNYLTKEIHLWRGCKLHDSNYKEYNFNF